MSAATTPPPQIDCWKCFESIAGPRWFLIRMFVCPQCGHKRCPKASDHRLACTGSNEPGQPGSIYSGVKPPPKENTP